MTGPKLFHLNVLGHQKVGVRHGAIVLVHCTSSPRQKKGATTKIEMRASPVWTEWRVERGEKFGENFGQLEPVLKDQERPECEWV